MTWRQLAAVLEVYSGSSTSGAEIDGASLLKPLNDCFYSTDKSKSPILGEEMRDMWLQWIRQWLSEVDRVSGYQSKSETAAQMRSVSPKYVPREWMLVEAYERHNGVTTAH